MAGSVVTLHILLAENVVELEAITQVIRADVGLTIQLLRSAKFRAGSLVFSLFDLYDESTAGQ